METIPGTPGTELASPLAAQTEQPGPDSQVAARTDGLAASLAIEHGAETGVAPGRENSGAAPKGRPGRPPVHGRYSKANGSDGKNPVVLPGETAPGAPEVESG